MSIKIVVQLNGSMLRAIVSCLLFLLGSMAYAEQFTNEDYQKIIAESSGETKRLIEYRNNLKDIPKEEWFTKERIGITWEEFKDLPRRALTDEEIAAIQQAAEREKKLRFPQENKSAIRPSL